MTKPKRTRPRVDLGTPETIRRRLERLGPPRMGWPQPDPAAAESALGTLLWQGYLHPDYAEARKMHDAGVTFCGWWVLVYPKTFAQGTLGRLQAGCGASVDPETAESSLRAASAFLGKERAVLDAVINVAVYQRSLNERGVEKLRTGLSRLAEWVRSGHERPIAAAQPRQAQGTIA